MAFGRISQAERNTFLNCYGIWSPSSVVGIGNDSDQSKLHNSANSTNLNTLSARLRIYTRMRERAREKDRFVWAIPWNFFLRVIWLCQHMRILGCHTLSGDNRIEINLAAETFALTNFMQLNLYRIAHFCVGAAAVAATTKNNNNHELGSVKWYTRNANIIYYSSQIQCWRWFCFWFWHSPFARRGQTGTLSSAHNEAHRNTDQFDQYHLLWSDMWEKCCYKSCSAVGRSTINTMRIASSAN